jgi:hypothetical protein
MRGRKGKVEGRYDEKTEALHSFEVRIKCVFSSTFGKTFDYTDSKKTKDATLHIFFVFSSTLATDGLGSE